MKTTFILCQRMTSDPRNKRYKFSPVFYKSGGGGPNIHILRLGSMNNLVIISVILDCP